MKEQNDPAQPRYREVQRMRQWWLWVIVLAAVSPVWYGTARQIFFDRPFGDRPLPDGGLVLFWLVFGVGLPVMLYYTHLTTEVRTDGVYYRYWPFHRTFRAIPFADIEVFEACTYRPLWEYGGWGIRYGGRRGWAYTVSGKRGVRFQLRSGRQILLGSREADKLAQAVRDAIGG
ncbi:MAG: hypothetical protein D6784_07935 [Chloroflexi bacterium]|nr:MAG: hypothetical protein D6784_07935 [Chloroflexota bacterium]